MYQSVDDRILPNLSVIWLVLIPFVQGSVFRQLLGQVGDDLKSVLIPFVQGSVFRQETSDVLFIRHAVLIPFVQGSVFRHDGR